MTKELSFRNLPFSPIAGQVIYIEQNYDEGLNKFIRQNYDWLKSTFRQCGFDFCYLPLLSEELVSYNAPYLSAEEREEKIKALPSLNEFVADGQSFGPSLAFALSERTKDDAGNAVLQLMPIELNWYNSKKTIFKRLAYGIEKVSKELNDKYFLEGTTHEEETKSAAGRFSIEKASNQESASESGDEPVRYSRRNHSVDETIWNLSEHGTSTEPSQGTYEPTDTKRYSLDRSHATEPESASPWQDPNIRHNYEPTIDDRFDSDAKLLIREIRERIEALQNKGINVMVLHSLINDNVKLSRLVITKKHHIMMPDYGNIEISMTNLPKAVFLLFLKHPEGIMFKSLADYHDELWQIYRSLQPRGTTQKQRQSISDLVDPLNNSINEKCARIREAFLSKIDDNIAKNYYITGQRGEPKRITLDQSLIVWEK